MSDHKPETGSTFRFGKARRNSSRDHPDCDAGFPGFAALIGRALTIAAGLGLWHDITSLKLFTI